MRKNYYVPGLKLKMRQTLKMRLILVVRNEVLKLRRLWLTELTFLPMWHIIIQGQRLPNCISYFTLFIGNSGLFMVMGVSNGNL